MKNGALDFTVVNAVWVKYRESQKE